MVDKISTSNIKRYLIHPSSHSSIQPPTSCTYPSVHPYAYISYVRLSIQMHPCKHAVNHATIHPSIHPSNHRPTHPPTHPPIHRSIGPSIHNQNICNLGSVTSFTFLHPPEDEKIKYKNKSTLRIIIVQVIHLYFNMLLAVPMYLVPGPNPTRRRSPNLARKTYEVGSGCVHKICPMYISSHRGGFFIVSPADDAIP